MATITPLLSDRAGTVLTHVTPAASGGDKFLNTGLEFAIVYNSGDDPITVTEDIVKTADGAVATDPTVTVAAAATKILGPWPPEVYNDASGYVKLTCSDNTGVQLSIIKVPLV